MSSQRQRPTLGRGLLLAVALGLPVAAGHAQEEAETESVWEFLQGKYDADHDGQVSRAEYDRGDEAYQRLDRDENGVLDEADFAAGQGRQRGGMSPEMMAPMVLMRYFEAEENEGLTREELEQSIADYDRDDDARISRKEFDAGLEQRGGGEGGMMGMSLDRYSMLLAVADTNDDLHLSQDELLAWFDERDSDKNGVWSPRGGRPGAGGPRGPGGGRPGRSAGDRVAGDTRESEEVTLEDPSPSALGKIAPDFVLEPPHGGEPVRLSSFKGEKPVALIFGSYT